MGLLIGAVLVLGFALWGPLVSHVEQPTFRIVESQGNIEIRDYPPVIVAETEVGGERNEAIREGFRTIAAYIFGNNSSASKVSMTAPVTQQEIAKTAMAAPVSHQGEGNAWRIRFVMPANYTVEMLPKPNNPAIKLEQIDAKRFTVIRFSGTAGATSLVRHTDELQDFLRAKSLNALSAPTYAFYNPPWTLPFLRRNEVMIEISS